MELQTTLYFNSERAHVPDGEGIYWLYNILLFNSMFTKAVEGWTIRCSIPGRVEKFFSFVQRPNWLWGPSNLLSSEYAGFCPERKAAVV